MTRWVCLCVAVLWALPTSVALGEEARAKRVLVIGIDGLRPDAIDTAVEAYQLKGLIREGAFAPKSDVIGDRPTPSETITGPGWSSILTGVWGDKHQVRDNAFKDHKLKDFPTFFSRLRQSRPGAKTLALVSWPAFSDFVFTPADDCRLVMDGDKRGYQEADRTVASEAVKELAQTDALAVFAYFGNVDCVGHGYGFHPKSPKYTKELEVVDVYIGQMLKAMRGRKSFDREDWLILICTDHGGKGKDHGIGKKVPEIRTGFIIAHGPSVKPGQKIDTRLFNVDVTATALAHLGVAIDPAWKLDGVPLKLAEVR